MQQDVEIQQGRDEQAAGCCGGGCCGGAAAAPAQEVDADAYAVEGMTCEHCVRAVTEEVSRIDGVRGVRVDLVPGGRSLVHVDADGPVDADAVRAAVDEAGYALVD